MTGSPLRIALVCPYSASVPGGVQNQVLGLADELRAMRHEVTVLAPADGPVPGVTAVGPSTSLPTNGSTARVAPYPPAAWRTLRTLWRGAFDVVHLHEPLAPSIAIPVLLAGPRPMVGTFHAAGDQTAYRLLGRALLRWPACRLDARVAVSETAEAPARRYLGGSYEVLWNGIDAHRFAPGEVPRADPPVVLFIGRDEPRKGLDVLLEAMARLPPDVALWVAGPATEQRRLRHHRGAARVRWLGTLREDDKLAVLRAASVVCVPSLGAESFGIVLLEAMAAGTPLVASDLPAYRAVTDDGRAAHLAPVADPVALADGLARVLHDHELACALRRAGLANAARYDMRALAEQYVAVYERVVTRVGRGREGARGGAGRPLRRRRTRTGASPCP